MHESYCLPLRVSQAGGLHNEPKGNKNQEILCSFSAIILRSNLNQQFLLIFTRSGHTTVCTQGITIVIQVFMVVITLRL